MRAFLIFLLALASTACVTGRPTVFDVPAERATECRSVCDQLGMKLGAMVVIMNTSGCVCEPKEADGHAQLAPGAAAAAAGATIVEAQQQQQRQQQSH